MLCTVSKSSTVSNVFVVLYQRTERAWRGTQYSVATVQVHKYGTSTSTTGGTYESLLLSQYSISISNGMMLLISLHITVYK